jgi:hypothetical protein
MSEGDLTAEFEEVQQNLPQSFHYNFTQEDVDYLWGLWADFSVYLVSPQIHAQFPPKWHEPAQGAFEHPFLDYGNELKVSRGEDLALGLRTYGRLMNTIDTMMDLIIQRAHQAMGTTEGEGGLGEHEIQVAFNGFEILQRKAFRVCIESESNVLVTNFDPGEWGERQLRCFNELVEKGYLRIKM